jgi:hypothetical protein
MPEEAAMAEDAPTTPLDHRTLARFARDAEAADPIDWSDSGIDPETAFDLMASQIAEMFRRYEDQGLGRDPQMAIALGTIVKLSVENFVLHQRLLRDGLSPRTDRQRG